MSAIAPHLVWFLFLLAANDLSLISGCEEREKRNLVVGDGGLGVGESRELWERTGRSKAIVWRKEKA